MSRTTAALPFLAILLLWEGLPRLGLVAPLFLPPLTEALAWLVANRAEFAHHLPVTALEIAAAYLLACGGGVALGLVVGATPVLRRFLLPWLRSLYAVPLVLLYPAIMTWSGLGSASKIWFAAVYALAPTMLATAAGVATVDDRLLLAARAMGASAWQRLLWIIVPASVPLVLGALRLGGALVIVGVIVAEMLGSFEGLGFLITRERTLLNSAGVYAGVCVVLALTAAHETLLRWLHGRARKG